MGLRTKKKKKTAALQYHCIQRDDSLWHDEVEDVVNVLAEYKPFRIDMCPHLKNKHKCRRM